MIQCKIELCGKLWDKLWDRELSIKNYSNLILKSIKFGDQIGGPYQLAKILTTNIKENEGLNVTDLTNKYLEWWKNDAFDTGPTFASVFTKIESGMDPNKAVFKTHEQFDQNTAGCGPAHRASPIAGFMEISTNQLIQLAKDEAKILTRLLDNNNEEITFSKLSIIFKT